MTESRRVCGARNCVIRDGRINTHFVFLTTELFLLKVLPMVFLFLQGCEEYCKITTDFVFGFKGSAWYAVPVQSLKDSGAISIQNAGFGA